MFNGVTPKPKPILQVAFRLSIFALIYAMLSIILYWPFFVVLKTLGVHQEASSIHNALIAAIWYLSVAIICCYLSSVCVYYVKLWDEKVVFSSYFKKTHLVQMPLGFLLGFMLLVFFVLISAALGFYHITGYTKNVLLLEVVLMTLFGAIAEEVIFRGFVFRSIEVSLGLTKAFFISSILFALAHVGSIHATTMISCIQIVEIVISGALYSSAYLLRRQLWLPIGLHWGWNTAFLLFTYNDYLYNKAFVVVNPIPNSVQLAIIMFVESVAILGFVCIQRKFKPRPPTLDVSNNAASPGKARI